MANTTAAKKAFRASVKKNKVNTARKNRIRTFIKNVQTAIQSSDEKAAREHFKALEPELMRGVSKKVLGLNTAARKLRKLAASIRGISGKKAA